MSTYGLTYMAHPTVPGQIAEVADASVSYYQSLGWTVIAPPVNDQWQRFNEIVTVVDAKGDLFSGSGPDAITRTAVGTNGSPLLADSAQPGGIRWASTRLLEGTGHPEGVVTAGVGTYYTDTAATAGAIRWVKATGAGNTGWKVEYGDTGPRQVKTLTTNGVTVTSAVIRRQGNTVTLIMVGISSPAGPAGLDFLTLPDGLKVAPTGTTYASSYYSLPYYVVWDVVHCSAFVPGGDDYIGFTYITDDPWPTTLPGSPA